MKFKLLALWTLKLGVFGVIFPDVGKIVSLTRDRAKLGDTVLSTPHIDVKLQSVCPAIPYGFRVNRIWCRDFARMFRDYSGV